MEDPSDWFGEDVEIELRPGGRVRVGERRGIVERLDPERVLSFRVWTPPPVSGSRVDFVLELLDDEHTVLSVTETQLTGGAGPSASTRPQALARVRA